MTLDALLQKLQQKGIHLSLDDEGGLKVRAGKGVVDAELLDALKQHKPELITRLQPSAVIVHDPQLTEVALTPQQQRLWLACQAQGEQLSYHMPAAVLLKGVLDCERFQAACQQLMQQQPLLRSAIVEQQGVALLQLQDDLQLPFSQESSHCSLDQLDGLLHHAQGWFEQPFDLEQAPLWRIKLIALADADTHLLLLNCHHLITDGWSNQLLLQQLLQCYLGESEAEPTVNYFDYAVWLHQQRRQQSSDYQQKLNFWRNSLSDCQSLNLSRQPRNETSAQRSQRCRVVTDNIDTAAVKQAARDHGISAFSFYQSALALLLHKLSGRKHFAVASPGANRQLPQLQHCVGYLVNTLSLACHVKPGATLASLMQRCHRDNQLAHQYGDIPFSDILDGLGLYQQRDVFGLLEAGIQYQQQPLINTKQSLAGLQIKTLPEPIIDARFPLTLSISDGQQELSLWFDYQCSSFSRDFVEQIAELYPRCVQALIEQPQQKVGHISLLKEDEQLTLLGLKPPGKDMPSAWQAVSLANQTNVDYQPPAFLHSLFEQQVQQSPDAVAVSDEQQQLSYRQLNAQANQLAHWLLEQCGSGKVIAVCQPRSVELSIALLAVLKSGNAYLPLDAELPQSRKLFIVDDAGAELLLGDEQIEQLPCVNLKTDRSQWQQQADSNPLLELVDRPLFNRIYTSGSSGKPKGVNVPHSGIVNRLLWMQQNYPLTGQDVVLQKTPVNFDVSVWELFWPLITGARLHYARPQGHKDVDYLCQLIEQQQITTMHFVPSMFTLYLQQGQHHRCQSLRQVFCSGEALAGNQVEAFTSHYAQTALHNLYGPTEASVDVSYFDCRQPFTDMVPIGRPIANTQMHILDRQLKPLPPGCIGEIYIGGVGLAVGYHQRDKLNHKRFIDNPWYLQGHPSPRLYRTGDLGSYQADGNIVYHGRKDNQIKLRGVRLELGDIEARALQHPDVNEAIALLQQNDDDQQLILFYTASQSLPEPELREFLAGWLSANMLPNRFVQLSALPLSHNGKADRRALLIEAEKLSVIPLQRAEGEVQNQVLDIWQHYLKRPFELDANFFELGGHSLMASRIIGELAQRFQVEIGFSDMLDHPTVAGMSALIESRRQGRTTQLQRADRSQPLMLSAQQQQLLLFQQLQPGSSLYHMPAQFRLQGELHIAALEQAFVDLIRRHEILHTCYRDQQQCIMAESQWLQLWQLEFQPLKRDAGFELLQQNWQQQPFDLQNRLPLRARLLQHGDNDFTLLFCLHHIAGDVVTLELLARDLAAFYSQHLKQPAPLLPTLHFQYADYVASGRQQDSEQQHKFWLQQLQGMQPQLNLPCDKPRSAEQSYHGRQHIHEFGNELSDRLLSFCRRHQLTPFTVLLSSYQLLLSRLSRQQDICVAVPVDGRQRAELAHVAGNLINTLPLRCQFNTNPSVLEWLTQQQLQTAQCLDHQKLPLEQLLQSIAGQQGYHQQPGMPLLQAGFNFLQLQQSEHHLLGQWPGLTITPQSQPLYTAKTDISWQCSQRGEQLQLVVEYNSELFLPSTIELWSECYQHLLNQLLADPQAALQTLTLLDDTERDQRLHIAADSSCYPLTAMQRDIWIDSLIDPDGRQNAIGFVTHSTRFVDEAIWEKSLQLLYSHCDSLRAGIVTSDDQLTEFAYQRIAAADQPMPASCFSFVDNSSQPYRDELQSQLTEALLYSPYSEAEPLWRVRLYRFADDHHLLILAVHHAMFDGVSMQMLGRLMKDNYERLLKGDEPLLPANNFADYVAANRQRVDSTRSVTFWQQQNIAPQLDLSALCAEVDGQLVDLFHIFTAEEWQQLKRFCREQRTTPPIYLKTLFALICSYQHGAEQDFLFGEVVSGRERNSLTTLGLFFEPQPNLLPADLRDSDHTITDLLSWFAQQRKVLADVTPLSLTQQKRLFPTQKIPYLFNFYSMESETGFQGGEEHIEHLMPQMDHAVNFICKVIDNQLTLQLSFNNGELPGETLLQQLMDLHHRFMQCELQLPDSDVICRQLGVSDELRQPVQTVIAAVQKDPVIVGNLNTLEQQLLTIWQQVLGRSDIGLDDNFFELGGHSLTAMAVASRVQEQLQLQLPLQQIFEQPTIRFIAQQLLEHPQPLLHQLPAIQPVPVADDYPLSFAQQRLWLLTQLESAATAYHMPLVLEMSGKLNSQALQQALGWVVERHQVLRSQLIQRSDGPRMRVAAVDSIVLEQQSVGDDQLLSLIKAWLNTPFVMDAAPLCRIALWQTDSDRQLLLFCAHHMIADAHTVSLIAADLLQAYQAATAGQGNPLTLQAGLQYQDYAVWQQNLLQHDVLQQQLSYWKTTLADAPLQLGLAYDYQRPQLAAFNGANHSFVLDKNSSDKLRKITGRHGVSLFMLLLGVYQLLLAKHASQQDICVGIPRDGRLQPALEQVAGFFINALVIRSDLTINYTVAELLQHLRQHCLQAFANELVPAEQVMQALELPRQLDTLPIVQAAFNLLHTDALQQMAEAVDIDGLQLQALELPQQAAKFDLLLSVVDSGEQLDLIFEYNSDLFKPETVQQFADDYQQLISELLTHSDQLHELSTATLIGKADIDPEFNRPAAVEYWQQLTQDLQPLSWYGLPASGKGMAGQQKLIGDKLHQLLQAFTDEHSIEASTCWLAATAVLLDYCCQPGGNYLIHSDSDAVVIQQSQLALSFLELCQAIDLQLQHNRSHTVSEQQWQRLNTGQGLSIYLQQNENREVDNDADVILQGCDNLLAMNYIPSRFNGRDFLPRLLMLVENLVSQPQQAAFNACRTLLITQSDYLSSKGSISEQHFYQQILEQQQQQPYATAVICGEQRLTYQQLAEQTQQMAQQLLAQGIEAGNRVALLLPKRIELLPALLAVHHIGGCYLLLESSQPALRIGYQLESAEASLVITDNHGIEKVAGISADLTTLNIDQLPQTAAAFVAAHHWQNRQPCYLIFTSGTAGLPKAVQVNYRSFNRLLNWYVDAFDITDSDTALLFASNAFDLMQKNFFAPLMCGGSLVLDSSPCYDPQQIAEQIIQHQVTLLNCAPSACYPLLQQQPLAMASLRLLLLGGESIDTVQLFEWQKKTQAVTQLVNMYGPSECTDISSSYTLQADDLMQMIPLGQPLPGTRLYLLNDKQQPVAEGIWGELYISGPSLSAGYCQQPALNQQAFIDNPFAGDDAEHALLYRTGDIAVLHKNSRGEQQLYHIGRSDQQIKLNGIRIEPAEIEHALQQMSGLNSVKVLLLEKKLIVFALAEQVPQAWRDELQKLLPHYMVPAQLHAVSSWPLTANGKLDEAALLQLASEPEPAAVAETELQQQLQQLWQQALGQQSVGIDDNFFVLGGDSIKAVMLTHTIEQQLDLRLPLAELFNAQTIRQQAELIKRRQQPWSPLVALQPKGDRTPLLLVHGLGGTAFPYVKLAANIAAASDYQQPVYALQAFGLEPEQQPFTELDAMLEFYIAAIKKQQPEGPYRLAGHSFGGVLALELARRLQQQGEQIQQLTLLDSHQPNSWFTGKLSEADLLKLLIEHNFGRLHISYKALLKLPREQMLQQLSEQLGDRVDAGFIERALQMVKGLQQMMQGYQVEPVDFPVRLVRAGQELEGIKGLAAKALLRDKQVNLGWGAVADDLDVSVVDEDHYSLLNSIENTRLYY